MKDCFKTIDAVTFADIKTVSTGGRCVLDLSLSSTNQRLAVITLEPSDGSETDIRLYEVGRYAIGVQWWDISKASLVEHNRVLLGRLQAEKAGGG